MLTFRYGAALARLRTAPPAAPGGNFAAAAPGPQPAATPAPAEPSKPSDSLSQYIPADIIAGYLPLVSAALTFPQQPLLVVAAYFVGLLATVFSVFWGYTSAKTDQTPPLNWRTGLKLFSPAVAFAFWGLAVPGVLPAPQLSFFLAAAGFLVSSVLKRANKD